MADLKISALTAATTPLAGTEVVPLVQSGVTKKVAVNQLNIGPSFSAYQSTGQAIAAGFTATKILFQTELWDTDSAFASSRFTPQLAGYYQISGGIIVSGTTFITLDLYKNGSLEKGLFGTFPTVIGGVNGSNMVYLNGSTDYVELYVTVNAAMNTVASQYFSYFQAGLVRNG
jgi:hypothetical protein